MSRLYISAKTDAIKKPITARAYKVIDTQIHFDDKNRDKHMTISCYASGKDKVNTLCSIRDANSKSRGVIKIMDDGRVDVLSES